MHKKENAIIGGFLLCASALAVGSLYLYSHKDMTGSPYADITAYQAEHPYKNISYTVTIQGSEASLELSHLTQSVTLTDLTQLYSLIDQSDYLQGVTQIDLTALQCPAKDIPLVKAAFPNARLLYSQVAFLDKVYDRSITTIDLSHIAPEDVQEAINGLQALDCLETVDLCGSSTVSPVSLETAAALHTACPHLNYKYSVELFGQLLTTDMERVEYFQVPIYDEGLTQFRKLLPMMHHLTYFKLDWCETTNEAMAQLRDDFAPQGIKVVWRVFWGSMNALTDTYRIWSSYYVNDKMAENFKYLTEVKYLDIGHGRVTHVDFLEYMPDLEVCIIAICNDLENIDGIRNCTKLEFLEVFTNKVSDLSPLENLKNLEYLNISYCHATDISPLYELPKLKRLWSTLNHIPQDQIDTFTELHPDCETVFLTYGDPTDYTWRFMDKYPGGSILYPRYALLKKQFGYETWDFSRYPRGYVTEEITYESTGITPPD